MKYCETHRMEYHLQCPKCTTGGPAVEEVPITPGNMGYTGIPQTFLDQIKSKADLHYAGKKGDGYGNQRRSGFQDGAIHTYQQMKGDKKTGAIAFETWKREQRVGMREIQKGLWVYSIEKKLPPGMMHCFPEYHNFTLEELYDYYLESTGQV